jgi:hypothetical protein
MNAANIRTAPANALRNSQGAVPLRTSATDRAVTALVSLCALTQFAIQAWLSYSFARDVWRIPGALCVAVIVALDLFVTVFMVLTYLLRTAHWRVRAYAWSVLTGGIGAQLFAAELFAQHEVWALPVRTFAALPALFLAASLHGLIKYRQHTRAATDDQGREAVPAWDQSVVSAAVKQVAARIPDPSQAPVTARPPRRTAPPAVPPVPSGRTPDASRTSPADVQIAEVRALVAAGVSCADAGRKLGKSKRWAEIHTKDIRASLDTQRDDSGAATGPAAIAAEGALSPKGNDPSGAAMQGDVEGHGGSKGTPSRAPDVQM